MKNLHTVGRHEIGVIFRDLPGADATSTGPNYWMICTAEGRLSDVTVWAAADVLKMYPDCEVVGLMYEPDTRQMEDIVGRMNAKVRAQDMKTTTSDGEWSIHFQDLCEDNTCRAGDILIYNETQQYFDASAWTHDDWEEFLDEDFCRTCVAEQMTEIDWSGAPLETIES